MNSIVFNPSHATTPSRQTIAHQRGNRSEHILSSGQKGEKWPPARTMHTRAHLGPPCEFPRSFSLVAVASVLTRLIGGGVTTFVPPPTLVA